MDAAAVKDRIRAAFASVEYPGDDQLVASQESEDHGLLAQELKGKNDWRALTPRFIDQAPNGSGSALSLFSDAAFRFYLPAFLIADVDGALNQCAPVFSLYGGLENDMVKQRVDRSAPRTYLELKRDQFAGFSSEQASAVVDYLRWKQEADASSRGPIEQALKNFWLERAGRFS